MVGADAALHREPGARGAGPVGGGFRLYGPEQLQRLRTLRELLDERGLDLGHVGLALRLRREPGLREAVDGWLDSTPSRPAEVAPDDWLRWSSRSTRPC